MHRYSGVYVLAPFDSLKGNFWPSEKQFLSCDIHHLTITTTPGPISHFSAVTYNKPQVYMCRGEPLRAWCWFCFSFFEYGHPSFVEVEGPGDREILSRNFSQNGPFTCRNATNATSRVNPSLTCVNRCATISFWCSCCESLWFCVGINILSQHPTDLYGAPHERSSSRRITKTCTKPAKLSIFRQSYIIMKWRW